MFTGTGILKQVDRLPELPTTHVFYDSEYMWRMVDKDNKSYCAYDKFVPTSSSTVVQNLLLIGFYPCQKTKQIKMTLKNRSQVICPVYCKVIISSFNSSVVNIAFKN